MPGDNGGMNGTNLGAMPTVGAPYELRGWFPTILIVCGCGAKEPIMIVGQKQIGQCKACKRAYQLQSLAFDAATNKTAMNLAIGIVEEKARIVGV